MATILGLMPADLGAVQFINALLVSVGVGISLLSDIAQNGNSPLGVLPGPVLPPYLGGPGHDNVPWGNRTANGTNYYVDIPDTGVTRFYDLTISRGRIAPDGFEKNVILVNGQFPGPLLEANWGDYFKITVRNNISEPTEGTTLHWHGLRQLGTGFYDGVPGISQCPIAPGQSLTYFFQADMYGTSWYHSHYTAQYTDGIYGPMVIYGPSSAPYDIDLGPLLVSDYYHKNYTTLVEEAMSTDPLEAETTFADNTLIQGKMDYNCSEILDGTPCTDGAGLAKLQFTSGKTHRIRVINPSSFSIMVVSIDGHIMTVIANDFVPVVPYNTTTLTLGAGQRTDILVFGEPAVPTTNGAYWLRARQPTLCALAFQPFGLAAIYYDHANTNGTPESLPQPDFISPVLIDCANDPVMVVTAEGIIWVKRLMRFISLAK